MTYNISEKTGNIAGIKIVNDEQDIMLITSDGTIIRLAAKDISKIGRDTQGVRVMKFKSSEEKVVCVANTPHEAEEISDEE